MRRFAKTIVKVLIAYADIVKKDFPEHMKDERIVSFKRKCLLTWCVIDFKFLLNTGLYSNEQHPAASCSIRKNV